MGQFIMAGLIGAIVVIVCYTTNQVIDNIDNRKHKTVYGLTPGRLYERPNRPPPPPIKLSADETLKRLAADERLKYLGKVITAKSPNSTIKQHDDINHPSHYT